MATIIRPELSERNKHHVSKHRHLELKHFCLQYPFWKKTYSEIDIFSPRTLDDVFSKSNVPSDPTLHSVEKRMVYFEKMKMVEQSAIEADADLADYILKAATEGLSYNNLRAMMNIPCSRDIYYDRFRRFFWILDKKRN